MKTVSRPKYFLLLLLTLGVTLSPVMRAQEAPPSAPPAPVAPEEPKQPDSTAATSTEDKPVTPATEQDTAVAPEAKPAEASTEVENEQPPAEEKKEASRHHHRSRRSGNERVSFGSNSTLAEDESAAAVISIFGSSTSSGHVDDAVVSILGSSRVDGGTVGGAVVSVLGNTYVNGEVRGEVVAVLGNVELGPKAVVNGEVVCIGGQLKRDAGAVVKGNMQNIAVAGRHFDFSSLGAWFTECLLYGRPLAFDSRLLWAWMIALGFLGFYMFIALIAPSGVVKCAETLEQRPGSSLLAALLTMLLTPVAFILLALTLFIAVGFVLIPLLSFGLFIAAIFGKIVMLAWLGRRFTKLLGDGPLAHPVFGVLIGGVIVLGLYTVPIVGFITYKLIGIIGLGVVVYTLICQFKASRPPRPVMAVANSAPVTSSGAMAASAGTLGEVPPVVNPLVSAAPPVVSAATLPRVGFWLRLAASVLDAILVGIVCGMVSSIWHRFASAYLLWFVVYCVSMWALKGTTIGGIICGLKMVRLDDRPLDWGVAIVRAMGGFLSLVVAGLGFIWVAFDDERQSWHDKIAGTTIVKVPKGTPLL
jgi:uncharacterized RDD family membrane protein YckC